MKSLSSSILGVCLGLVSVSTFAADESTRPGTKTDRPTQPEYKSPSAANQEQMTDQQFVYKAALCGQKEVMLSQLALEKSQSDEVKNFAKKMIADHSQVDQQLAQIAQSKGFSVPATNAFELAASAATPPNVGGTPDTSETAESPRGSEQKHAGSQTDKGKPFGMTQIPQSDLNAVKKLQDKSGPEFDTAYASEMVKDHQQAVTKFEQASRSATDPELKQFATSTLSKLREHSQMAEQLAQTTGAQSK